MSAEQVEVALNRIDGRRRTSMSLSRTIDGVNQYISVHGDPRIGYVLSSHEVDEANQDVREAFLNVHEAAAGEVELSVHGCATPFASKWVGTRDDVLAVLLAFLRGPLAEVPVRWDQTIP